MIIPNYFIDENLKIGSKIKLESHFINHATSILSIIPFHPDFRNETRYKNKILTEMATIYARLKNQYNFKYHIFSTTFYRINEEDLRSDETEFFIDLKINHKSTESDNKNIDVSSQLEHQSQFRETKESGWIFDRKSSRIKVYETGELEASSYVKLPLRPSALKIIKNDDKCCFLWSNLAYLHPCETDHPNRVPN